MILSRSGGVLAGVAFAAAVFSACEATKSSNPLSPSVAGPIPGVTITAPRLLEPGQGWQLDSTKQPITLLVENAATSGVRPLTYLVEIAADAEFTTKLFAREGIAPGPDGRTAIRLPDSLVGERTYYWRARAQDGANTGPFSAPASFLVFTPIVLEMPVPISPSPGQTISGNRPTFVFRNAPRSGPAGPVSYTLQIATADTFAEVVAQVDGTEQPTQTQLVADTVLPSASTFFWRVRANEPSKMVIGPWAPTQLFRTAAPPPTPTPTPTPVPQPTPPGDVGAPRTISPEEALTIIRNLHDTLGYNLGSSSTRENRIQFFFSALAAIHYGHPRFNPKGPDSGWCVKDAGGGRPPSDDVMVRCSTREAWDTISGAGADGYRFDLASIGRLPSDQNVYAPPRSSLPR
jgi:hypothetical protein